MKIFFLCGIASWREIHNEKYFCHELAKRGLQYQRQVDIPAILFQRDNLAFSHTLYGRTIFYNKRIMNINANHFFLKSEGHQLYAMLYEPQKKTKNLEGYIIMHPFAEEKKSSQKVLVDLAVRLCNEGNTVLLFDFYGCGDSEGNLSDAGLSVWLNDLKIAIGFLKEKTNCDRINLLGLRMGAFVGILYTHYYSDVNKLILIEPFINPAKNLNRSLRSKLMKELCTDGEVSSRRSDLLSQLDNNNSVDFSGHEISTGFYKELIKFSDIEADKILSDFKGKCLLINVSQMGKPSREFQKLLQKTEKNTSIEHCIINMQPFWGQIDLPDYKELIGVVAKWCKQ